MDERGSTSGGTPEEVMLGECIQRATLLRTTKDRVVVPLILQSFVLLAALNLDLRQGNF
jgi:hypothetical protein